MKLTRKYFEHDSIKVARDLLGKYLVSEIQGKKVIGKIVETEAYHGMGDLACHASRGLTPRTRLLFGTPGHLYVYLNYGIFYLTNIVCAAKGTPSAVLLRAVEVTSGQNIAKKRLAGSKFVKANKCLATGPGKLSIAFGIDKNCNGLDIIGSKQIYILDNQEKVRKFDIIESKRIGVDYAKHCKDYLWRFYVKGNEFISKK